MPDRTVNVTATQVEVLEYRAHGLTTGQIATAMGSSLHAVKFHLANAARILGAENGTHAVVLALKKGYLKLEDL